MRLDKLLAHAGYGSRKDVKELLKKKRVEIANKVVVKGNVHVNPQEQIVTVDGEAIYYERYLYMMVHKPQNFISATVDDRDKTVIDLVPEKYQHYDLAPVGRLDKDTEGLILLTNDGMLNHIITSPKTEIYKTYYAKIDGVVEDDHIKKFLDGVVLDDGYKTIKAYLDIVTSGPTSEIELSICEGKFHQVKRMFRAIDMEVIYLKRIRIGDIYLDKDLPIGKTRLLNQIELAYIESLKK